MPCKCTCTYIDPFPDQCVSLIQVFILFEVCLAHPRLSRRKECYLPKFTLIAVIFDKQCKKMICSRGPFIQIGGCFLRTKEIKNLKQDDLCKPIICRRKKRFIII